jgi:hypothetical protein
MEQNSQHSGNAYYVYAAWIIGKHQIAPRSSDLHKGSVLHSNQNLIVPFHNEFITIILTEWECLAEEWFRFFG